MGAIVAKHTPAPWRATYRNIDGVKEWASRIPYAIERLHPPAAVEPIADICDQPNAEANARLIAAAPDGLALALAVAEHFADTNAPLGKMARDFIAKVEGR